MNKFIIGFVIGLILGASVTAYAAAHYVWVNGNGVELGTATNPVYVTT